MLGKSVKSGDVTEQQFWLEAFLLKFGNMATTDENADAAVDHANAAVAIAKREGYLK